MIRYGYACKTIGIPGTRQRTCTLANATEENLLNTCLHNLAALDAAVAYCHQQNIKVFRISSDIIPLASHPQVSFDWKKHCAALLKQVGANIRKTNLRVSMHPGQYTVLNSPKDSVVDRAVEDLIFHAEFLDALEVDLTARIILHVGGAYGNHAEALESFTKQYLQLPKSVSRRLALENDERSFTIEHVLQLCHKLSVPALFDVFHHSINPAPQGDTAFWLREAGKTWSAQAGRQKIHYSQQLEGGRTGSHSRTIVLNAFLPFHDSLKGLALDVMLEVKDKNLSAVKCINVTTMPLPRKCLTEEWARYKYAVMEHSQSAYQAVRELLKQQAPQAHAFYTILEDALMSEPTLATTRNAAEHVWGYFSKYADDREKKRFATLLAQLDSSSSASERFKKWAFTLAEKYQSLYLLQSLYFSDEL